jgi:predicted outer membrane repeat protein
VFVQGFDGRVLLEHATVANNTSDNEGGGIFAHRLTVKASIIADNSAPSGSDCKSGQVRSLGVNLIEDSTSCEVRTSGKSVVINADPMLGPLQNNGGATETHALLAGSPAIGVVTTTALCKAPDQRGQTRAVPCDLGSYEAP